MEVNWKNVEIDEQKLQLMTKFLNHHEVPIMGRYWKERTLYWFKNHNLEQMRLSLCRYSDDILQIKDRNKDKPLHLIDAVIPPDRFVNTRLEFYANDTAEKLTARQSGELYSGKDEFHPKCWGL